MKICLLYNLLHCYCIFSQKHVLCIEPSANYSSVTIGVMNWRKGDLKLASFFYLSYLSSCKNIQCESVDRAMPILLRPVMGVIMHCTFVQIYTFHQNIIWPAYIYNRRSRFYLVFVYQDWYLIWTLYVIIIWII